MRKMTSWKLFGALLLVGFAMIPGPIDGQEYCCNCDYSYSYFLCRQGCPSGDQACYSACYNEWTQAEWECAQSCPWPIC